MNLQEIVQIAHEGSLRQMEWTPDVEWHEDKEFDLIEGINKTKGIVFEIAGPTSYGYKQIGDMSRIEKPIVVSNIINGNPKYDIVTGELRGFDGKVDLQTDTKNIPLKDASVGTFMVSCLPQDLANYAIAEMERVIEPGGFVVWQLSDGDNGKALLERGFTLTISSKPTHRKEEEYEKGTVDQPTYAFFGNSTSGTAPGNGLSHFLCAQVFRLQDLCPIPQPVLI